MTPNRALYVTLLLIAASVTLGIRSYSQAESRIVADLNQALHLSVLQNQSLWLSTDSIQTYARLQQTLHAPIAVNSGNRAFTEALTIPQLKDKSQLSLHILKKGDKNTLDYIPHDCIASDTLMWLSNAAESSGITLSFRGYARCSAADVLALSDLTLPGLLLLSALLWGGMSCLTLHRKSRKNPRRTADDNLVVYGNLSLSRHENCFYNPQHEKLHLTPMQYALMEMFYLSPSHQLARHDICQALWPGKENADETLYTLIRRLKPIIENNSNLRITTDRGRAYGLEINE